MLREPLALRQMAFDRNPERLALTAAMLSKRYREDLPTIVKANVPVNFLLPGLIASDRGAPAIFLYSSLRDYLLAILRSENHRGWLQRVTVQLESYLGDLSGLSDAERCAALWLAQMQAFTTAVAAMPNARTLDSEDFFADPRPVLRGRRRPPLRADAETRRSKRRWRDRSSPLIPKNPDLPFDNEARLARRAELEEPLAPELARARSWIDAATGGSAPDRRLPGCGWRPEAQSLIAIPAPASAPAAAATR